MRRKQRASSEQAAWELLAAAPVVHLATTSPENLPILRTLNAVVHDGWVLFHGAIAGEKNRGLGRPAVVAASESVAAIDSTFVDPEQACPATTYFRSVQARGPLLEVESEQQKRAVLEGLMKKYQPRGGYRSFLPGKFGDDDGSFYEKELKSVRIIGVRVEHITGKDNLGQERPTERTEGIVRALFRRGDPSDMKAIETVLLHSPAARPDFLQREQYRILVHPTEELIEQHAELIRDLYWREGVLDADLTRSIRGSNAWVGAVGDDGRLWGAARATTDGAWTGRICDVVVAEEKRGACVGRALMQCLLQHPAVREVRKLRLGTLDKQRFYGHFGFEEIFRGPAGHSEMCRTNL